MRKEKQNFWQRLKGAKMRILFSLGYFALLTASATALFFLVNIVRVSADGESRVILTTFDDRDKLLRLANVSVEEGDKVYATDMADNFRDITVRRSFTVPITADGETVEARIVEGTVEDCLAAAGVTLGEHDFTDPSLDRIVKEGDSIRVYRVEYRDTSYEETIPYETVYRKSSLLYRRKNKSYIMQDGKNGTNLVTYRERYVDGEQEYALVSKVEVLEKPTDAEVLVYGAGAPVSDLTGPNGESGSRGVPGGYSRMYTMSATGYTAKSGKGASRLGLYYGTVAVNPNLIPYGTKMYIASPDGKFVYGWAIATDTGSSLMENPNNIDLFYETYTESLLNGRITVNVYVYG